MEKAKTGKSLVLAFSVKGGICVMCTIRMLICKGLSRAQEGKDEGGRMKDDRENGW